MALCSCVFLNMAIFLALVINGDIRVGTCLDYFLNPGVNAMVCGVM